MFPWFPAWATMMQHRQEICMNERNAREISRFRIISAGNTDKGKTRKDNEDAFFVDDAAGLYAVADGIGGHAGGEVASRMAVEAIGELVPARTSGSEGKVSEILTLAFKTANTRLHQAGSADRALFGMGTTLTALLLQGGTAHLAHIGDSRAYLLRDGVLNQMSEDHGLVAEQVRAGIVTPEQARRSPYRHVITRALGIDREAMVDYKPIEMKPRDIFLLCTDGLTEMVEDVEIERILSRAAPPEAAARLIDAANDHGGVDNITLVVVKVEGSS